MVQGGPIDGGSNICKGDSGGPVLDKNGLLTGVISFAFGQTSTLCENHPGGSGRVDVVYDWVQSTMCANLVDKTAFSSWCCPGNLFVDPFERQGNIANVPEYTSTAGITSSCGYSPQPGNRAVFMDRFMGQDKCMRIDTSESTVQDYYLITYFGDCDAVEKCAVSSWATSGTNTFVGLQPTFFANMGHVYRFLFISFDSVGTYSFKIQVRCREMLKCAVEIYIFLGACDGILARTG